MVLDPSSYRGFGINIEIIDGRFVPSIHDPLTHKEDGWAKMPGCAGDSMEEATRKVHAKLDAIVKGEVDECATKLKVRVK